MGMTGPGETHQVEVEIEGGRTEQETKEIMRAIRDVLKKYGRARVGRQLVFDTKKTREPDPKPAT
jgi:FKBP-type peptidyl-prolyl cis-trans isomerase 2